VSLSPTDARLLDALRDNGRASVPDLASSLGVGEATVRRGLGRLQAEGLVIRSYGGAVLAEVPRTARGAPDPQAVAKRLIGEAAADLVRERSTIALSSGTTVLELAQRLRGRQLTVITNAIDVVNALLDDPGIEVIVLGGVLLGRMHSLHGHLTEEATKDLRVDAVFMGASAIELDQGFMTDQVQEIQIDRALRRMARECVILADSSKFDRVAAGFMFGFNEVATIVTDDGVRPDSVAALEALGVRLVVGTARRAEV